MTGVAWLLRARLSLPLVCLRCRVNVSPGRGIVSSKSPCYLEIIQNRPRGGICMADEPITLKALLRQRHWTYTTFCAEYEKTAKSIDPRLSRTWPSRAQFQRWLAGELRGLPYPDARRVLEAMFPGWTIEQLFAGRPDGSNAQPGQTQADHALSLHAGPVVDPEPRIGDRFLDVSAVFATRSEFISNMPAHTLFDHARNIRACGLSLNLLCQQYSEHSLRRLAEGGSSIQCLFLDPDGEAIRQREQEENYAPGTLSELTRINIRSLQDRVRNLLTDAARPRLEIATYIETIRFNIILVDEEIGVVQPYLPALRGIDSPTFVLRRRWENQGLFPIFEAIVSSLWTRARTI